MISTDKAYLFGLLVGAGDFGPGGFSIKLPYKSWGDQLTNPARAGQVASDILLVLNPICSSLYGFSMGFTPGRNWTLFANEIPQPLADDLAQLGLPRTGEFRTGANLEVLKNELTKAGKQAFIVGLADAIGSLQASHRRFSSDYQVVSLEFAGFNFPLVSRILEMLSEVDCVVDQVLWNHPNQHAGTDRYYHSWKKGMKIRVMLGEFASQAGFGFQSKVKSAAENVQLQHNPSVRTGTDRLVLQPKCAHVDENSPLLPADIRGEHFIHWQHLAARLGVETVTKSKIEEALGKSATLISPFTLLTKGTDAEIERYISEDVSLTNFRFEQTVEFDVKEIIERFLAGERETRYGTKAYFLTTPLVEGFTYPILVKLDQVSGRRYKGKLQDVCRNLLTSHAELLDELVVKIDHKFISPLTVSGFGNSTIVGPISESLNKGIIDLNLDTLSLKVRALKPEDLIGWT